MLAFLLLFFHISIHIRLGVINYAFYCMHTAIPTVNWTWVHRARVLVCVCECECACIVREWIFLNWLYYIISANFLLIHLKYHSIMPIDQLQGAPHRAHSG